MIDKLPDVNQLLLKRLFQCLKRVTSYAQVNKMTVHNIGKVFGPNLLRPPTTAPALSNEAEIRQTAVSINMITITLIQDFEEAFKNVRLTPYYKHYAKVVRPIVLQNTEHIPVGANIIITQTEIVAEKTPPTSPRECDIVRPEEQDASKATGEPMAPTTVTHIPETSAALSEEPKNTCAHENTVPTTARKPKKAKKTKRTKKPKKLKKPKEHKENAEISAATTALTDTASEPKETTPAEHPDLAATNEPLEAIHSPKQGQVLSTESTQPPSLHEAPTKRPSAEAEEKQQPTSEPEAHDDDDDNEDIIWEGEYNGGLVRFPRSYVALFQLPPPPMPAGAIPIVQLPSPRLSAAPPPAPLSPPAAAPAAALSAAA
eukprot:TRINITY_DN8177_c0_g1_i1.p1 TRINITY_DN8177_c0_g1~~TRINITY_DN8177_c0_g1_i1.p1  ORF type:complete len:373 (+),score=92.42 TRINITY_DN8177_c0_g1_i1:1120-2238(+)